MTARVLPGAVAGFDAIVIENRWVRAVVVPALGGRVWKLEDLARHRQWIWHRPGVAPVQSPVGAPYDDVWAGGWEELFPNDAPGRFEGRELPDHGEWWAMPWSVVEMTGGKTARVRLEATSKVVKAHCTKEFLLDSDAATLAVSYRIRSLESAPFHYLFKQHLPIAIVQGCRLALPGGTVEPVDPSFSSLLSSGESFDWPMADRATDLRAVSPPSSRLQEFVYVRDLPAGWCGMEDPASGASIRMDFDAGAFPYVWLFLTYGGWRDLYTAVLEPCTNMPKDLEGAVRAGQSALLRPGQEFATTVSVTLGGMIGAER